MGILFKVSCWFFDYLLQYEAGYKRYNAVSGQV